MSCPDQQGGSREAAPPYPGGTRSTRRRQGLRLGLAALSGSEAVWRPSDDGLWLYVNRTEA